MSTEPSTVTPIAAPTWRIAWSSPEPTPLRALAAAIKARWSCEQAHQQLKEELGLESDSLDLIGNYIFERKNEVVMCYHVVASGTLKLGRELAEVRRVKPAELRPWRRATGLAVADWMRSRGLEVRWDERAPLKSEPTRT